MEQRLTEQWLTRLPKNIAQHTVHIEEVGAGRADSVFIQLDSGLEYFVKQSKPELINKEQHVLLALAKQSSNKLIFPHIYTDDVREGILITEKLSGQTPTKSQLLQQQSGLIRSLAELHQLDTSLTELEFAVPDASVLALALKQSGLADPQCSQIQTLYDKFASKLVQYSRYPVLNHGDLTPFNMLLDNESWQLIDWEYACKTDARWDLATLTIEFSLSKQESMKLVDDYKRLRKIDDVNFLQGFESWQYFYLVTCLVWAIDNQTDIAKYCQLFVGFIENIKK